MKMLISFLLLVVIQGQSWAQEASAPEPSVQEFYIPEQIEGFATRFIDHPEKTVIAVGTSFGGIVIYDYKTREVLSQWTLTSGQKPIGEIEFLPGNLIFASVRNWESQIGEFEVWNWKTAKPIYRKEIDRRFDEAVVSPDGRWIATISLNFVDVFKTTNGDKVDTLQIYENPNLGFWYGSLFFTHDGQHFFLRNREKSTGYVYRLKDDGVQLLQEIPFKSSIISGKFSSDNQWLVTTSKSITKDKDPITIEVRDVATGKLVSDWVVKEGPLYQIDLSVDKKYILAHTENDMLLVWKLNESGEPTLILNRHIPTLYSAKLIQYQSEDVPRVVISTYVNHIEIYDLETWDIKTKHPRGQPKEWGQLSHDGKHYTYAQHEKRLVKVLKVKD